MFQVQLTEAQMVLYLARIVALNDAQLNPLGTLLASLLPTGVGTGTAPAYQVDAATASIAAANAFGAQGRGL